MHLRLGNLTLDQASFGLSANVQIKSIRNQGYVLEVTE